ncbi:MAG: hypothetical protein MK110_16625 [Fuerstiella sp.]|nr:hypothetical protein [Fuerstiella sp.]
MLIQCDMAWAGRYATWDGKGYTSHPGRVRQVYGAAADGPINVVTSDGAANSVAGYVIQAPGNEMRELRAVRFRKSVSTLHKAHIHHSKFDEPLPGVEVLHNQLQNFYGAVLRLFLIE